MGESLRSGTKRQLCRPYGPHGPYVPVFEALDSSLQNGQSESREVFLVGKTFRVSYQEALTSLQESLHDLKVLKTLHTRTLRPFQEGFPGPVCEDLETHKADREALRNGLPSGRLGPNGRVMAQRHGARCRVRVTVCRTPPILGQEQETWR